MHLPELYPREQPQPRIYFAAGTAPGVPPRACTGRRLEPDSACIIGEGICENLLHYLPQPRIILVMSTSRYEPEDLWIGKTTACELSDNS